MGSAGGMPISGSHDGLAFGSAPDGCPPHERLLPWASSGRVSNSVHPSICAEAFDSRRDCPSVTAQEPPIGLSLYVVSPGHPLILTLSFS